MDTKEINEITEAAKELVEAAPQAPSLVTETDNTFWKCLEGSALGVLTGFALFEGGKWVVKKIKGAVEAKKAKTVNDELIVEDDEF